MNGTATWHGMAWPQAKVKYIFTTKVTKFSENQLSDLRALRVLRVLRDVREKSSQNDNSQVIPKPSQRNRFNALNFIG